MERMGDIMNSVLRETAIKAIQEDFGVEGNEKFWRAQVQTCRDLAEFYSIQANINPIFKGEEEYMKSREIKFRAALHRFDEMMKEAE